MHALQVTRESPTSPTSLKLIDAPQPTAKPGFALVKIKASSINPSDLMNTKGAFPSTTFPRIPGRDFAGTVVDGPANLVNKDVYGTSGGDFSFVLDGSHAEYALVPEALLAPKPRNLSFVQAANVGVPFTTAFITLERARAKAGEVVLVTGASGAVGTAAVQLARSRGCRVLTAGRSEGADVNLKADPEMKAAKELTGGKGPDVIVDTTGDLGILTASLSALASGGRLSYIAAPRSGDRSIHIDLLSHYRAQHELVGCNSLAWTEKQLGEMMSHLTELFESKELEASPDESFQVFNIKDGVDGYTQLGEHKVRKPMIVFD
jgi:NADPH:quinone reductase